MMPAAREIIARLRETLTPLYGEREAEQTARAYLMERCGWSLTRLVAQMDDTVSIASFDSDVAELAAARPLQYVVGSAEFCDMRFTVREGVLIPRPETEELVRWVVADYATRAPYILDIGTGSGAIACSLALLIEGSAVSAVDISAEALALARTNAAALDAAVDFREADALQDMSGLFDHIFDIIVSNPPYIPLAERSAMRANVTEYEPAVALFVADDEPLVFYRAIARSGQKLLRVGGKLYFEVHERFAREVCQILTEVGYVSIELRQDANGKERMICCQR